MKNWLNILLVIILSLIGKTLAFVSRVTKKGSGTALPGLLVERYFPWILESIGESFQEIIMISGTNGKTTTRALLVKIYRDQGMQVCTNRGGANIIRGIASSLLLDLNLLGKVRSKIAILEVEEASLPILTKYIKPHKLILTNIFRDQLDAYGEINKTLEYFKQTLANCRIKKQNHNVLQLMGPYIPTLQSHVSSNVQVFVNADDHKLLSCLEGLDATIFGYSLDLDALDKPNFENSEKSQTIFTAKYLATNIYSRQGQTTFTVKIDDQEFLVDTNLLGYYNLYNIMAALLAGFNRFGAKAINSIADFQPVFGRGEKISLKESNIWLFLVKNPAGFDQVLQLIPQYFKEEINLAFLINDKIADGKDISWLWDTHLEGFLKEIKLGKVWTGGSRGLDMLLRLEYSGVKVGEENFVASSDLLVKTLKQNSNTVVLATYTAMMEFRSLLQKETKLSKIDDWGN